MKNKLISIIEKYNAIENQMADKDILSDPEKLKNIAKEYKQLEPIVKISREYLNLMDQIIDSEEILDGDDLELKEIAEEDLLLNKQRILELEQDLKIKLLPKDPLDNKNIILEIRAGTGGDEAALFAADLFRMYSHFAEKHNWGKEMIASNEIGIEKAATFSIICSGDKVFPTIKMIPDIARII